MSPTNRSANKEQKNKVEETADIATKNRSTAGNLQHSAATVQFHDISADDSPSVSRTKPMSF